MGCWYGQIIAETEFADGDDDDCKLEEGRRVTSYFVSERRLFLVTIDIQASIDVFPQTICCDQRCDPSCRHW